jgi:TRAP-type C4-dicarboxylate transport system permease small subunit
MNHPERKAQAAYEKRRSAPLLRILSFSILSVASAVLVGFMMFLTFADVLARYVFNSPILGAYEITEVIMGLMIFGGLPLISGRRTHISVDLFVSSLPDRLKTIQKISMDLICGLVAGILGWRAWIYAGRMAEAGERTLELKLSWGVIIYVVSVLLFITAWIFISNAWTEIRIIRSRESEE